MTAYLQSDIQAQCNHLEDRFERLTVDLAERNAREDSAASGLASLVSAIADAIDVLDVEGRQRSRKLNELEARMNSLLMGLATRGAIQ